MGAHRKGRTTSFMFNPKLLKYTTGKYYRGEIDRLRRAIKSRKADTVYLYIQLPMDPVEVVIAPEPLEESRGLSFVGVYNSDVTAAMLRDDLPYRGL